MISFTTLEEPPEKLRLIIDALRAENERLREQVEEMSGTFTSKPSIVKDAERLQWILNTVEAMRWHDESGEQVSIKPVTREAIDAAMGEGE